MNKNPFEVRLDIMKMAQEMLDKEQEVKMAKFNSTIQVLYMSKSSESEIRSFIDNSAPTVYSSADVVAKATELYDFVSTSSGSNSLDRSNSPTIVNNNYRNDKRK